MTFSVYLRRILKSYGACGLKHIFFGRVMLTTSDSLLPTTCTGLVYKIESIDRTRVVTLAQGLFLAQCRSLATGVIMCVDIQFRLVSLFCTRLGKVS